MMLPGERNPWSDIKGKTSLPKERFILPGLDWEWEDIWHVEKDETMDEEGWQYAQTFKGPFNA